MPETPTPDQTPTAPEAPAMIPLEAVAPLLGWCRCKLREAYSANQIDPRLMVAYDRVAQVVGIPESKSYLDLEARTDALAFYDGGTLASRTRIQS